MDAEKPPRVAYHFDRFTLDLARGALLGPGGTELPLRPKSFALLGLFVENPGSLLDRDSIMRAVWPDVFVTDDSITQCVRDIRRALGDEAGRLLRTVPRRGYLLATDVSRAEAVVHSPILAAHGEEPGRASPDVPAEGLIERQAPDVPPSSATGLPDRDLSLEGGMETPSWHRPPSPGQAEPTGPSPPPPAERRQLTVLFCELAGSTSLAERLDPEDLGAIIRAYQDRCAAEVAHFGGHVATYLGDGMLAYFGYPRAHEDAAERAVRAGLAIAEAVGDMEAGPGRPLRMRVGVATGLVVDDRPVEGARGQVAVGRPLNLAARLQAIAEPGTVVVADETRRLVGGLFALEDLGRRVLEGFAEPVRAWRVAGEGAAEDRFEALRAASLTAMVGRGEELILLLERWEQAKEGEGQAVLLGGEPGIGKSRLVRALRDRLAGETHAYLGYHCSPHYQDSPLRPVAAHLERAAGLGHGDDPGRRLAGLEALLAREGSDAAQLTPLIAPLLSIPDDRDRDPPDADPRQRRKRTLAALVDRLVGSASRRPVLLVWEDVHWADPTSLELLGLELDRLQDLPVLALITFRPEFVPPWPGHTHVTRLTLNRLGRRRCDRLVAALAGGKSLPPAVLDRIVAGAEGVPLFLEELTKAVLESGLLREEEDRYELEGPPPSAAVPATLQDSLMARLDRLAPVKRVAQVAAVIGREFSRELLDAVLPSDEGGLDEALGRLGAAELVFPRGTAPHTAYVFKHALVRDAAYASLLKGERRLLHARIARALEERFPGVVEAEPEVLAHHLTEAGETEKASAYRLRAGDRALARSATAEAVAQLTTGLELLPGVPDGAERRRRELDLQIALGAALCAAKGQAAPETARAYARARELCGELGDEGRLVPALLGLWASHNARDELRAGRAAAARLLRLAERRGDGAAGALGHRALGATLFGLGEFATARAHLERLLALDRSTVERPVAALPYDPWASGRAWLALTLAVLGYPDQALARAKEALAEAGRLRHHNTTALALSLRCSLGQFLDDHRGVAAHAEALLDVAAGQGFAYWAGLGAYFRGWARARAGEAAAGIAEMRGGLAACEATGARAYAPYNLALVADACRRAGDAARGRRLLDEALDWLGRTDARYCEAELLRIDGELRLALGRPDQGGAEASLARAVEVARRQEAKVVELRAATSLARLWVDVGERRRARDLLAPIHGWFTEGFDTEPLLEAERLLSALA